jgi:pyruvate,water dikinase
MPEIAITLPFRAIDLDQLALVGGKNANLGVLLKHLEAAGVPVPDGFAITTYAFRRHLREARLEEEIYGALDRLDVRELPKLAETARAVRDRICAAPLPADIARAISAEHAALPRENGESATDVAVRSSATVGSKTTRRSSDVRSEAR